MSNGKCVVIHWEWGPTTKFAGGTFWAVHGTDTDGRILDWPKEGLIPLGASEVEVVDGKGLDLLAPIAERTQRGAEQRAAARKATAE